MFCELKCINNNRYEYFLLVLDFLYFSVTNIFFWSILGGQYINNNIQYCVFRKPELVDRLNDIIAKHYPDMLAV
ncbi:hypothetical protein BZL68_04195 [Escherichia coli]|nr:hypothetical protein BZL68_04195 [Escherichia coli]